MKSNGNGHWMCSPLSEASKGNAARFEDLTRQHLRALWRTALRMTGDSQTAEDLTQETCLRAYRSFDSYEDGTNYRAWIFRIMSNLCTDHLRRQARAPFVSLDADAAATALSSYCSEADRPDVRLLHKTFRSDAFVAMGRLSPEVRLVVSLALVDGCSYQEISQIADCPVGTVRSRLSRGRQQLQEDLKEYTPAGGTAAAAIDAVPAPAKRNAREP